MGQPKLGNGEKANDFNHRLVGFQKNEGHGKNHMHTAPRHSSHGSSWLLSCK